MRVLGDGLHRGRRGGQHGETLGLVDERAQRARQLIGREGIVEQPALSVAHQLGDSSRARRHHRHPGHERLVDDEGGVLRPERGDDQHVDLGVDARGLRFAEGPAQSVPVDIVPDHAECDCNIRHP